MRIAIGQLWQETNTFNPLPTTLTDFEAFGIYEGDELVERMAKINEPGGFIQSLHDWPERPQIVGLVRFAAWPSGPLTADSFATITERMFSALRRAGTVDGVLLALHGSLVAVSQPDVEGYLLDEVR